MHNDIDKIIGANLSRRRTIAGLTQKEMADACLPRITMQQVSKYELGDNQTSSKRLLDFARVLKCNMLDLLAGIDDSFNLAGKVTGQRADYELMSDYHALPENLKVSVRKMVRSMAAEIRP